MVAESCGEALFGILAALSVVDVARDPARAEAEGVLATPTLVKIAPAPIRRIFGNFADPDAVAAALGLDAAKSG